MSLDDRLREILPTKSASGYKLTWEIDRKIAQIKQAFDDEGYLKHPIDVQTARDPLMWDRDRLLTGQEWYHRYYTEIHKVVAPGGSKDAVMVYKDCDEAAKRAAGLSDELEDIIHLMGDGWLIEAFDLKDSDKLLDLIERCEADVRKELIAWREKAVREARIDEIKQLIDLQEDSQDWERSHPGYSATMVTLETLVGRIAQLQDNQIKETI